MENLLYAGAFVGGIVVLDRLARGEPLLPEDRVQPEGTVRLQVFTQDEARTFTLLLGQAKAKVWDLWVQSSGGTWGVIEEGVVKTPGPMYAGPGEVVRITVRLKNEGTYAGLLYGTLHKVMVDGATETQIGTQLVTENNVAAGGFTQPPPVQSGASSDFVWEFEMGAWDHVLKLRVGH